MTISTQIKSPAGVSTRPTSPDPGPSQSEEPKDRFISEHNAETVTIGLGVGLAGAVLLGIPAAIGAAGGALGVAAVAVGAAALAMAAPDDTEYPGLTSPSALSGALNSAAFAGCLAGIGVAAGVAGAVTCAAVGACVGGVFMVAGWQ